MPKRLGDIVSERALASFAGRKRELDALFGLLEEGRLRARSTPGSRGSLRKKLGPQARALETVRGTGYRYRDGAPKDRVGSKLTV